LDAAAERTAVLSEGTCGGEGAAVFAGAIEVAPVFEAAGASVRVGLREGETRVTGTIPVVE
jgi:hypothetical protein